VQLAKDPNEIYWIIESGQRPIGWTAIHRIDWRQGSGITGTVIGETAELHKGMGSEAMRLRTRYALTNLPLRKLKANYVDGNVASARALESVGYRTVGRYRQEWYVDGRWEDVVLTEILKAEWEHDERERG
jgi:RimJ/RimL family protein N-acetyltransferase